MKQLIFAIILLTGVSAYGQRSGSPEYVSALEVRGWVRPLGLSADQQKILKDAILVNESRKQAIDDLELDKETRASYLIEIAQEREERYEQTLTKDQYEIYLVENAKRIKLAAEQKAARDAYVPNP